MYLSIYLPIYLSIYLSLCLSIYLPVYLQAWKRSNSARCLHFSKLTTSKRKQFCETSSIFELNNVKNEAILRDFFIFHTWQHQKRSNSARLPSKMESCLQRWRPRTNAFCDFSSPPVESTAHATKKCQVIRSAVPVTGNHLSKPEDLMLQKSTPLRKSAPWPPNSSDENVSCTAPATENASLQILFKCPTPAIVFGNATKPSRFAHFWEGAQSLAPATRNELWTSTSGPYVVCFVHFDFRATTACSFSTSQLLKVLRSWSVLYILTSKCASGQNGVHFSTSQLPKVVRPWCVLYILTYFDLEMYFAPQRRALFHLSSGQMAPHPPL